MSNPELHISWDDFHIATKQLADKLKSQNLTFDKIIAIARGGLIPSGILGQELNIRHIDTICISSYGNENHLQTELKVLKDISDDGHNILVIDDLVDTGKTFKLVSKMLPNAHRACIYAKPHGRSTVNTYVHDVPQETWVYFPWEIS